MDPRVSVALCTFNGASYLSQQLESIASQSRMPDELVVCDDASTDGTLDILLAFAERSTLPVHITRNPARMGVRENFGQAIERCTGEIIFLCDQDDVWDSEKIECMLHAMRQGADWVCCDAGLADDRLAPIGKTLWQRVGFTARERRHATGGEWLPVLLKHYIVAGATLAFRASARKMLLPIPASWPFDAWLAAALAATARGTLIDRPLQRYRQHAGNTVGGMGRGIIEEISAGLRLDRKRYYLEESERWKVLKDRLPGTENDSASVREIDSKLAHLDARASFPANRLSRIPGIVREWRVGGYSRYARNWGGIAIDLLLR